MVAAGHWPGRAGPCAGEKKRKEKTTLAATTTVSDSTAGISLEEAE